MMRKQFMFGKSKNKKNQITSQNKIRHFSRFIVHPSSFILLAMLAFLALPLTASAHPLGNFTVNRYSRIEIGAAGVKIYYVLDMAEIPTFQEKDSIDLNHDSQISETERNAYLERKAGEIQSNLKLSLDSVPTTLKVTNPELTFLNGQGGLQTTRLTAQFETAALPDKAAKLSYQDNNFGDRLGWREVVVRNATGVALLQSSAPATDQTNELRVYPEDMLASPLTLTSAQVNFKLDPTVVVNNSARSNDTNTAKSSDPFASLINSGELTIPVILLSLVIAFILGTFHALSPGHGKTVVAAYLIGSRGTARHAAFLGLTVTVTHTLGVFALGLLTLFASQFILPEKLYPWLGLLSGLIVVGMGITLFRSRLRFATASLPSSGDTHSHDGHTHEHHDHDHEHSHDHDYSHEQEHVHAPAPVYSYAGHADVQQAEPILQHSIEHTDHDHTHDHEHHEHDHDHTHEYHEHAQPYEHIDDHDHDHSEIASGSHVHSHGGKAHSHLPPGVDGTALTWKRLLFFGISAVLLPCPSALVVMLSAIALNRTAFGMVLIVFFSMGLAATLTAMGLLFVYAGKLMKRLKLNSSSRIVRLVPVVSAFIVAVLGIVLSYEALIQTGILNR